MPPIRAVYFSFDRLDTGWARAIGNGPFAVALANLSRGSHVLYAYAVDDTDAGGTSRESPTIGAIAAYAFVVVAAAPGAPMIGSTFPGNGQASFAFTEPASNGGSQITSYTATCNPGAIGSSSMSSPITVTGLTNGVNYSCAVTATNSFGTGIPSSTSNVIPSPGVPLSLIAAFSRKTHGGAGVFELPIATAVLIGGAVTVEPRTLGAGHMIAFRFNSPISSPGTVSVRDASGATIGGAGAAHVGSEVQVSLAGLPDNQRVNITLVGVSGTYDTELALGFLVGDVNNTRSVNSSDISGVKARSGQETNSANFKFDLNASGAINSSDISAVKARSGLTLP